MALKGAIAKQEVTQKILDTFKDSFVYEKEIRIPWVEEGIPLQLKVTLTAAKVMVDAGGDTAIPGETKETAAAPSQEASVASKVVNTETSAEEKANLSALLRSLGL